jgi:hypothetical protein
MAASVRIEDEAFGDGRYEHLGQLLGTTKFDALGRMSFLWRQCTQENSHVLPESFVRVFVDPEKLVESRLGERVDTGIRIRGTRGRIEWLAKLRKNGRKGGRPRKPNGYPNGNQERTNTEPESNPPAPAPAPAPIKKEEGSLPDRALATKLILRIIANHPGCSLTKLKAEKKTELLAKWADHVRLMREVDKHSEQDISAVIDWCQSDTFWRNTILSAEKLRKQWDQLIARMGSKAPSAKRPAAEQPKLTFLIDGVEVER